jgi:hypothetical protein
MGKINSGNITDNQLGRKQNAMKGKEGKIRRV